MKKTALITGASGGIGLELSKIFAREGYDLILVARSEDKLKNLKNELEAYYKITAQIFPKDLAEKDSAESIYEFTKNQDIDIDILVNNAGFGDFGAFKNREWQKQYDMIQLNITALIQLTHLYLKPMTERGSGKILNLASIAAFQPGPMMSVYYATKAFVLSFTEALSVELKHSGVSVTALCPGPTKTGFEENADLGHSGLFKHMKNASARDVAEYGYRCLTGGKVIAVHGGMNKFITFLSKISPRRLTRNIVYRIQK